MGLERGGDGAAGRAHAHGYTLSFDLPEGGAAGAAASPIEPLFARAVTARFLATASDGTRLHYRTPTEGGNSGSPVFDEDNWMLVGLHHAGSKEMPRLRGQAGTYEANEAVSIAAIRDAIRANRMS